MTFAIYNKIKIGVCLDFIRFADVVMRDKGHDVAEMDPALGWNYVKQFRRLPNGELVQL